MAADLIMPTLPGDQEQSRHFLLQRPQHNRAHSYQIPTSSQISPLSTSTSTASNASASSSPNNNNSRQNRPMFMPAVLRPNSDFAPQPLVKSSTVSNDGSATTMSRHGPSNSFAGLPGLGVLGGRNPVHRPSKNGPELIAGLDLNLYPQVTAQPTRNHWKVGS